MISEKLIKGPPFCYDQKCYNNEKDDIIMRMKDKHLGYDGGVKNGIR